MPWIRVGNQAPAFLFVTGDPRLTARLQIDGPILYSASIQPMPSSCRRHSASSNKEEKLTVLTKSFEALKVTYLDTLAKAYSSPIINSCETYEVVWLGHKLDT
ncbi:hypothetical protein ZWY2020_058353 [Hordeum vulgare]|nr:hypothetical protein ZWY2020_058353 [Hordeum vulgare]